MSQPFTTPQSSVSEIQANPRRSTIFTVFGIIGLIIGGVSIIILSYNTVDAIVHFSDPILIEFEQDDVPVELIENFMELLNSTAIKKMQVFLNVGDLLFAGLLIIASILLLQQSLAGRTLSILYCVGQTGFWVVSLVTIYINFTQPLIEMGQGLSEQEARFLQVIGFGYLAIAGGLGSCCTGLIYPATLLICMFSPGVMRMVQANRYDPYSQPPVSPPAADPPRQAPPNYPDA